MMMQSDEPWGARVTGLETQEREMASSCFGGSGVDLGGQEQGTLLLPEPRFPPL